MRLRKILSNVKTNPLTKSAFYCSVPETLMAHSSACARSRGAPETLIMHSSARARSRGAPETQTNHVRNIKKEE